MEFFTQLDQNRTVGMFLHVISTFENVVLCNSSERISLFSLIDALKMNFNVWNVKEMLSIPSGSG